MNTRQYIQPRVLAVAAVALLFAAPPAFGGGPELGCEGSHGAFGRGSGAPSFSGSSSASPGRMLPLLLKQAELTPEQKLKVGKIMRTHKPSFEGLFAEMREAREAMSAKVYGPGVMTQDDVDAAIARMNPIRERLMREGMAVALEVRALLTAEQIDKMAKAKRRMEALREEMADLYGGSGEGWR